MKKILGTITALVVMMSMTVWGDEPAVADATPQCKTMKSAIHCSICPLATSKDQLSTIVSMTDDKVFAFVPNADGAYDVKYV
ncbi:MAG: hypothetical protein J6X55_06305 [Victivallales bacterium]|nr:hypothetical protein [Victivallales bacterium]